MLLIHAVETVIYLLYQQYLMEGMEDFPFTEAEPLI